MWSVECGVWSVECEVWSVECGVCGMVCVVCVVFGAWRVSRVECVVRVARAACVDWWKGGMYAPPS